MKKIIVTIVLVMCLSKSTYGADVSGYIYYPMISLTEYEQWRVTKICEQKSVPVLLMFAIMRQESDFHWDCVCTNTNGTTDYGICQINSCWSSTYKFDWKNDKWLNVWVGADILQDLMVECNNDLLDVLSMYNTGKKIANSKNGLNYAHKVIAHLEWIAEEAEGR